MICLRENGEFIDVCDSRSGKIYYGGRQQLFSDERYRSMGCGSIALANVILYFDLCDRCGGKITVSLKDYMKLADELNMRVPPDVNGIKLEWEYRRYSGCKVKYSPLVFCKKERLFEKIKFSLSEGRPLILSVYNKNSFPVYEVHSFADDINHGKEYRIKAHYMTVTGISEQNGGRYLLLSNWGGRFLIDFDSFFDVNKYLFKNGIGNSVGSGVFWFLR